MANFTITVGPVRSAPVTVDTAKAIALVDNYLAAYGLPTNGTNQQKVDALTVDIARHVREVANGYARQQAEQAAKEAAEQAAQTWE